MNMARKNGSPTADKGKKLTFTLPAQGAERVQLAGDFTHWQEQPINMRKTTEGVWRASVELKPGEHHYRFLVDGQWQDDPACTQHVRVPLEEYVESGGVVLDPAGYRFEIGRAKLLREGDDVAIISTGLMTGRALPAVIVYLVFQRYLISGLTMGISK